jgi:predicted MFS family arabinose efflux permease
MQQEPPAAMMGRVSSSVMSSVFLAQVMGLVVSAVLGQVMGVRTVFILCAVLAGTLAATGHYLLSGQREESATA